MLPTMPLGEVAKIISGNFTDARTQCMRPEFTTNTVNRRDIVGTTVFLRGNTTTAVISEDRKSVV